MPTPCSQTCWIIGYGNPQRRDDGIGPFVVNSLKDVLKHKKAVSLLALHQLGADRVEELCNADRILFVDATINALEGGRVWSKVHPETQILPYLTHHIHPSYLLGLIQALYHRSPPAWLVSIQGYDFGFGEGLSPGAEQMAKAVSSEIIQFIDKRDLTEKIPIKKKTDTGDKHGKRRRHPHY